MTPAAIDALLRDARDAYGSANAELLGDLAQRLADAVTELDGRWRAAESRIAALEAENAHLRVENADLRAEVTRLSAEVARLAVELEATRESEASRQKELGFLRAKVFGSTSERGSRGEDFASAVSTTSEVFDDDSESALDGVATDSAADDAPAAGAPTTFQVASSPASDEATSARPRGGKTKRKNADKSARSRARKAMRAKQSKSQKLVLSPEVERQEVDVPVPKDLDLKCPACSTKPGDRGVAETAREIDVKPSQLVETTYKLHEARCLCGALRFTMPGPVRGVPQTNFSPAFIAQLVYDKYVMHLPGFRQAKRLKSQGVTIDYRRINSLIILAWLVVKPLVARLRELNRQEHNQSVDESPIRVVIDGEKEQRYLWCLVSRLAVSFVVTKQRNKETARKIVGNSLGTLTSDRLSIYRALFEDKDESGCMSHCRRYYWYALASAEDEALAVIEKIKELYAVEDEAKARRLTEGERRALRQEKSAPLMAELKALVESFNPPPRSPLGRAVSYTLTHWTALCYFLADGVVEIDNNRTEGELRDPKLGQKNYLFAQCEDGVDALAGFYTLVRTALMYEHDPRAYLVDLLGKLNSGWPQSRLDELLPWNWRPPDAKTAGPVIKRVAVPKAATVRDLPRVRGRLARARGDVAAASK